MSNLYPLSGTVHNLGQNKQQTIKVGNEGAPQDAYEVIVYSEALTGYNSGKDESGELVVSVTIPNRLIERKLACYVYEQKAYGYNSENISFPVGPGDAREIKAELKATGASVNGSVQIVGYRLG
ncbi:Hypothetical predicted protein [Paramuricea clavata]|uniref:Uncharacterized protein n=1 Tax=Paramuricea clavata TaxID=317549 RepID=A0A6S7GQT5_PARCT|nr:Hypothetical predicted protein [Paramuricea clavata]